MANYDINITATDNTKGAINSIQGGLGGLGVSAGKVKAALGAAGAALGAFAIGSKIKGAIDDFDNLAKSARLAGATASNEAFQGFQVLQTAMAEAGVDAGTFERAMLQTTSRLQEGLEGGKSFAGIVEKLGTNIQTADGQLVDGATALKAMVNALNEGTISTDEFAKVVGGRAGPLIQQQFASLNKTAEDLEATLADVEGHANIVPLDAAENAELFNDTIGRLQMALGKLLTDAITPLLPHLTRFAEELLANMPAIIQKVQSAFETLQPVFSLIGTVLTDLVFPIMQKVFEVLGFIAEAITPLVDSAIPALKAGFEGLVGIVESIVGFFQGVAETLGNIYDKAIQLKEGVTGTFDSMADSVKSSAKDMTDSVSGWFSGMYEKVVGGSIVPDMVNEVLAEFKRMQQGMVDTTQEATAQAADGFQNFSDTLVNALSDGKLELNEFEGFFRQTMTNILNEALSGSNGLGNIFGSLFGGGGGGGLFSSLGGLFGGGGGGLFSSIGSIFGGFFSNGGYLSGGKVGIVGENGPEMITGPANITPMDEAGGVTNINFTINAIDSRSGTEFILEKKKDIEGIIQNAYTRRGKQGIY